MELSGKTALVLGATGGLGREAARVLAREGMNVAAAYLDWESRVSALEKALAGFPDRHLIVKKDLIAPGAARDLAEAVAARFGGLHVLVNNVERGGWPAVHGPYTPEQWDLELATTITAKRNMFEAALPHLIRSGGGAVVNVSSMAGIAGRSGPASPVFGDGYSAANAGILALTRTFARMAAPTVRVNELMLGFFETRHGPGTRGWEVLTTEQKEAIRSHTLLGRTGTLKDAMNALLFLIRDAAFMTGQRLVLEGGYLIGGEKAGEVPAGVVTPDESVYGA